MSLTYRSAGQLSKDHTISGTGHYRPATTNKPMSLVISPDLEALLEYDDHIRGSSEGRSRPETPSIQYAHRYQGDEQAPPMVGLPPPRRRSKAPAKAKAKPPQPSITTARNADVVGSMEEMSFAKPDYYDDDDDYDKGSGRWSMRHTRTRTVERNPYINPAPSFERTTVYDGNLVASSASSLSHVQEQDQSVEEGDADSRQQGGNDDPSSKPLHLRYLDKMEKVLGRNRSSGSPQGRKGRELQKSHHYSLSGSCRSEATETTCEPSSSPEPQISISSTIYSASANHSGDFDSPTSSPNDTSTINIIATSLYLDHQESTSSMSSPVFSIQSSHKPPIPTTPKPNFVRPSSRALASRPGNYLSQQGRAGLIRKTRKLTQMFGQTPCASVVTQAHDNSTPSPPDLRNVRNYGSMSVSHQISGKGQSSRKFPSDEVLYVNNRRHSTPLTPQDFSFLVNTPERSLSSSRSKLESSSFIDLSDEELVSDTPVDLHHRLSFSTLDEVASLESLTAEEEAEKERRRKRDKLAKLHRFLGSRVPPELALGFQIAVPLPPIAAEDGHMEERTRFGRRRRRSSSFAEHSTTYVNLTDRLKSELDDEEKAVNVKRAAKMEKVFGTAPPQTLYHTRHTHSPGRSADASPLTPLIAIPAIASFGLDYKGKKTNRPGTGESNQLLLPKNEDCDERFDEPEYKNVYNSYRDSLNSLSDIINRDDKESLERLHEIMHSDALDHETPLLQMFSRQDDAVNISTARAERRRSLPSQPSLASISSRSSIRSSINSPPPEISSFEQKRRRAAKLTNFFGVTHREIMDDILESIEKGVEEECGNGTLNPEEVDDLLQTLEKLKHKT